MFHFKLSYSCVVFLCRIIMTHYYDLRTPNYDWCGDILRAWNYDWYGGILRAWNYDWYGDILRAWNYGWSLSYVLRIMLGVDR